MSEALFFLLSSLEIQKLFPNFFFGFMFVVDGRIFFLKFSRQNNIR